MSRLCDHLADDSGKAVFTLGSITLPDNYQFVCVGRLVNTLVYFLLRYPNWEGIQVMYPLVSNIQEVVD